MLSFSFVVLLHVFGAIVALIPQYFYFRDVAPMTLEPMLTQMRSMKGMGSPADVEQTAFCSGSGQIIASQSSLGLYGGRSRG